MNTRTLSATTLIPALVADIIGLFGLWLIFPTIAERFQEPSGTNALILSLGFILFCVGVFWLRRMRAANSDGERIARGWWVALAAFFAVTMSLAISWQLGFFESGSLVDTRDLGEGGSAVYFVFAPGAWLGFSFLYVLVLAFTVSPTIEAYDRRRSLIAFLSLLSANVMLLLLGAQARAIAGDQPIVWAAILVVWFSALFFPPRLIYTLRQARWPSPESIVLLVSLGILISAFALATVTL